MCQSLHNLNYVATEAVLFPEMTPREHFIFPADNPNTRPYTLVTKTSKLYQRVDLHRRELISLVP